MNFQIKVFIIPLDAKHNFAKLSRNVLKQLDVITRDTINKTHDHVHYEYLDCSSLSTGVAQARIN